MSTDIRPEISKNNKYWISKHRYYELRHFCMQYKEWKELYSKLSDARLRSPKFTDTKNNNGPSDITAIEAIRMADLARKIKLVEDTAEATDEYLADYILRAVTENLSYTCLATKHDMPCGKDMYYDRFRRFYWLLSKER